MRLLEVEAKKLLGEFGVATPPGRVATSPAEAASIASELGCAVAVKAQVLSGKRGKRGGILRALSPEEAAAAYPAALAATGAASALVEAWLPHARELYVSIAVEPADGTAVLLLSAEGGVDVEDASGESGSLLRVPIDPFLGLRGYHVYNALARLGVEGEAAAGVVKLVIALYRAFRGRDASLVEVNPLALDEKGRAWALDAKVAIDEFALFRQPTLQPLAVDDLRSSALQREMDAHGLQYIPLGGDVGVLSIGAGITMALVDWLTVYGARAACFVDYVVAARQDMAALRAAEFPSIFAADMEFGLRHLLALPVRSLLINITSGGTPVDGMTRGFVHAVQQTGATRVPIGWYVNGNGRDRALGMLSEPGIQAAPTLGDAVRRAAHAT